MTARTITPAPYSLWARTSQMKSGTPMNRTTVSRLGMVNTRSWSTRGWPGRAPAPMNLTRPPLLAVAPQRGLGCAFQACSGLVGAEKPPEQDHQDGAGGCEGGQRPPAPGQVSGFCHGRKPVSCRARGAGGEHLAFPGFDL